MKYRIWDVRDGLLADDKTVEAKSPIEAVRKLYNNVKRVKNGVTVEHIKTMLE